MNKLRTIFYVFLCCASIIGCSEEELDSFFEKNNSNVNINEVNIKIITFVPHNVLDAVVDSTRNALINKFHISKDNISVFNPNGKLDEVRTYVRSLNSSNTNLVISISTPTTQVVLSELHPNIPLLFSFVSNVDVLKLSEKNNVTGISNVLDYPKGFELLNKIIPNISKLGVVYNPSEQNSYYSFTQIEKVAKLQDPIINVVARQFTKTDEISVTASTISDVNAFYVGGDNSLVKNIKLLLNVAEQRHIPVFASDEGSVKNGAIASYSINYSKFGEATASLAIKVLQNKKANKDDIIMYKEGDCVVNIEVLKKLNLESGVPGNCREVNQ